MLCLMLTWAPGCLMLRWVEWRGRLPGSDGSKYMLAGTGVELHHHNVYISTKIYTIWKITACILILWRYQIIQVFP